MGHIKKGKRFLGNLHPVSSATPFTEASLLDVSATRRSSVKGKKWLM